MKKHRVTFQPSGRRGEVEEGTTLQEAARQLGVELDAICGGRQVCGKCKIRIDAGLDHLSSMAEAERELLSDRHGAVNNYRLACAARVLGDVLVFVPEESRREKQIVRKTVTERAIPLRPAIRKCYAELTPATLEDPLADWERLRAELAQSFGLKGLSIDHRVLLELQDRIREGGWRVTVTLWMDREVIRVEPGYREASYGLAVDVGTTTVAGYLCDLATGRVVATAAIMNPQVAYGEDVMSRIAYAMNHEDGLVRLNEAIIEGLNLIARQAAEQASLAPEDIVEVCLVGNTCMHHLVLGLNPRHLGVTPFTPALSRSLDVKARELGLRVAPGANVHLLPIEAGFVGADNVGVLIAEEPYNQDEMTLIIDIGTNGELVLGNRQRLLSASCATGPAFEGAHIQHGMRAAPGAIERVEIDPQTLEVRFKVVGLARWSDELERPRAKGICGSGIVDAVAEMFKAGVIDASGRFKADLETPRLRVTEQGPEFVIAWTPQTDIGREIAVSLADVRAVQLGKAALYAGARLLMRRLGVEQLDRVILAGAFGSYIHKESALVLGLFPDCDLERVYAVGNAAGDGARIALLNVDKRREAEEIARRVEYVELTVEPGFQEEFMRAMYFPHMRDPFPHVEQLLSRATRDE
ncbi:MAG TPA: DUF4445 domain-containing protein [Anaerolineae bacterium]|nr:DUF4445 domain-containing protein [Anaerolineae bacterium]